MHVQHKMRVLEMSMRLMPGPCSGKKFAINLNKRLYSKEKGPGCPLLF